MLTNLKMTNTLMMRVTVTHLLKKKEEKPSRNAVNICKASNDVLDKDINFLFSDTEKHK